MRARLLRGFLLDDVLVEPLQGLVTYQDTSSHLSPQAVGVLLQLALQPGQLVSREILLEEVFEGREKRADELVETLGELGSALGDAAGHPRFIQHVPGHGYRLLVKPVFLDAGGNGGGDTDTLGGIPPLFRELMLRKVVQTGVAYLIVGWLLIQVADTAFDNLGLPWWSASFVTILVVVGFPLALMLSWFIEFAGGKVRFERRIFAGQKNKSGIAYLAVVLALLVSAAGLSAYRAMTGDDSLFGSPPAAVAQQPVMAGFNFPILPNSVAVLRFLNIGGDNRFSDGLSDSLLDRLANIGELAVPSRVTTWAISDENLSATDIAERLRVRYVLEGSVQHVENNIRVIAQMIDGQSGHHLWSRNYDRILTAEEYFAIQDDITSEVVKGLKTTLSLSSMKVLERDNTTSTRALNLYLLGTQYLREPKSDESLTSAVQSFQGAIEEDSRYAEAYAGLCDSYLAWFVMTRDIEYFENAEKPCLRALTLDDSLAEVYAAMGSLHRYAGRYDEAQIELEKAHELMPHSAPVLEELGRVYRAQGEFALAERAFKEAIIAEPSSWSVYKSLGNFLYRTGRYEEALPLYQHVIELVPDESPGYNNLGGTYFMLGRFEEATRAWEHIVYDSPTRNTYINYANTFYYQSRFEQSAQWLERALQIADDDYRTWENLAASLKYLEGAAGREAEAYQRTIELATDTLKINPNDADALVSIALAYARSGDTDRARETAARLAERGWDDPNVSFYMALVHLELGRTESALEELERAKDMGFPVILIAADPDFKGLRDSPRFMTLIEQDAGG